MVRCARVQHTVVGRGGSPHHDPARSRTSRTPPDAGAAAHQRLDRLGVHADTGWQCPATPAQVVDDLAGVPQGPLTASPITAAPPPRRAFRFTSLAVAGRQPPDPLQSPPADPLALGGSRRRRSAGRAAPRHRACWPRPRPAGPQPDRGRQAGCRSGRRPTVRAGRLGHRHLGPPGGGHAPRPRQGRATRGRMISYGVWASRLRVGA
jgi:hypothetical protein